MHNEIQPLDALRDEWQALQPLSAENETRLWKKLRLEWNYHSNHIEGNTLTYGETELLLLHERTTGNHSHREYLEMKAHDKGIDYVRALAADKDRLISESDIRDLNRIILKEPFWKYAETPDGQSTRKEIIPGQYKTTPNSVRQASGEMLAVASVEETPARMGDLVAWLRQELTSPTLPIAACIAKLHHNFVIIHPFEDGNGRVARLLVNYVLIRSGHLPLIVRTDEKEAYLTALRLADAGELSALMAYLQRRLEWSLQLGIKAAKGESIEEPSDLEKEVAIFVRNQQGPKGEKKKSAQAMRELLDLGLREFIEKFDAKLNKLAPLFTDHKVKVSPTISGGGITSESKPLASLEWLIQHTNQPSQFSVTYEFLGYGTAHPFNVHASFKLQFGEYRYILTIDNTEQFRRPYSEPVLPDEAESLANKALAHAFAEIKKHNGSQE